MVESGQKSLQKQISTSSGGTNDMTSLMQPNMEKTNST